MIRVLLFAPLLLAAWAAAVWSYRSLGFGAGLAVLIYVVSAAAVNPIVLPAAGRHVYLEDILGGLLIAAAAARFGSRPRLRGSWLGWVPFAAMTAIAFVLGTAWYGARVAGVEYRGFFSLCAVVFYCSSFPLDSRRMKQLITTWLGAAAILTAIAWFRWWAELLNLPIAAQWETVGGDNPWRVLNAGQALFLAQSFLMLLYLRRHDRTAGLLPLFAFLLAITVVLLQHRSVWVATALAAAAMAWHEGQLWRFVRIALPAAALLAVAYGRTSEPQMPRNPVAESLQRSIAEPFQSNSTTAWRIGLWSEYLAEYSTLPAWQKLVGTGLGNGAVYRIGSAEVETSAHNYYVFVLNRAGLLGLLALLGGYGTVLWRLRGTGGHFDYIGMLLILTISQIIYFAVYSPSCEQGLLVGAGFGIASGRIAYACS